MTTIAIPPAVRTRLQHALERAGSPVDLEEALAVLDGLNGAPQKGAAADPGVWPRMIAPEPDVELVEALIETRAALAAAVPTDPPFSQRVGVLRAELTQMGLDGFVIPHGDQHQSEFIPAASQRLAWLTGFTGSAGVAVVLQDQAAIFVDGRYTLQVRDQVDTSVFEAL